MGKKIILIAAFLFLCGPAFAGAPAKAPEPAQSGPVADTGKSSSGLPIPRFVSLAADKVFVRTGPALRYPIKWVYQRQNLPVEIIQEFDTWRKIRDMDGDDGWVHQSLLSGDRYAIVKGEINLAVRKEPGANSRISAFYEPDVVASLSGCEGEWCRVRSEGYEGWAERKFLWGIYDSEDFD
ncbi:MAG TPA: SH3 domain-containing protein [Micavibrio sp.]|nr:SH3 domain-containing protein [Micavibrio sp.]